MIRYLIALVVLLGVSSFAHATIPVTSPSSRVKADASLWKFRTHQEMDSLIKRNYNNPRASYYIVNNAYQKGFATHAALMYLRNARSKRNFEPKMWVGAAYAAMVGGGDYAYSLHTPNGTEFMEVMSHRPFLNTQLDLAVKEAPESPEVLLMCAASLYGAIEGVTNSAGQRWDNPQWKKLFSWLRQAQKLDPQWGDAHYWYGVASKAYWRETGRRNTLLLPRAKTALLSAQRLDPNLTGSCAWMLWTVADSMQRPAEQLHYMNVWFKWQPRYAKDKLFQGIHARLVQKVGA